MKKVIYFKDSWLERIVTFSLVGIILISSAFMSGNAQASLTTKAIANSASTNILALDSLQKSMDDAKAELDKFALDTQRYIDKAIADTNKAIERLPEELERAKIYTKFTARAAFKRDMEAREKLLSDAAEYMDNLAKEADSFDKELQRQAEDASSKMDARLQKEFKATKRALEDASQALAQLATDTERSAEDFSDKLQAQIRQDIKTVDRALEDASQAVQDFVQSAWALGYAESLQQQERWNKNHPHWRWFVSMPKLKLSSYLLWQLL